MRHALPLVFLLVVACKSSGGSNSPNVIEQAAGDIEHEVDQADDTARKVGDDVEGAVDDVVDGVSGSDSSPSDAASDED